MVGRESIIHQRCCTSLLGLSIVSCVSCVVKELSCRKPAIGGLVTTINFHLDDYMGAVFFSLACRLLQKPWIIDEYCHRHSGDPMGGGYV